MFGMRPRPSPALGRRTPAPAPAPTPTPSVQPETTALLARMTVQPDATRAGLINNLITGLKSDGVWTDLSILFVPAAHDAQAASLNWIRATAATNNGCEFVADRGYRSGVSSTWVDWGETPGQANAAAGGGAVSNQCVGAWCTASGGANASAQTHVGAVTNGRIQVQAMGDTLARNEGGRLNDPNSVVFRQRPAGATRVGHRTIVRADGANLTQYLNGADGVTVASAVALIETGNLTLFRILSTYAVSNDVISAAYFGAALTPTKVGALHARLGAYLAAVGAVA